MGVDAGCALTDKFKQCLGCGLSVLATRNPGTCVGPFPCRFSGTP